MSFFRLLSDDQFTVIADLQSSPTGAERATIRGRWKHGRRRELPVPDGIEWWDLPRTFPPRQTAWAWHRRLAAAGTWDVVLDRLLTAAGTVDWPVSRIPRPLGRISTTSTIRTTGGFSEQL